MRLLNMGPNQEVVENLRLDFVLILTSGKGILQQRLEVEQLLSLYNQKGYIVKYQDIKTSPSEISATVFCPSRAKVFVQLPP